MRARVVSANLDPSFLLLDLALEERGQWPPADADHNDVGLQCSSILEIHRCHLKNNPPRLAGDIQRLGVVW